MDFIKLFFTLRKYPFFYSKFFDETRENFINFPSEKLRFLNKKMNGNLIYIFIYFLFFAFLLLLGIQTEHYRESTFARNS